MSNLALTKTYGDLELLFAADIHDMWTELEDKTNGNIDSDNVASGWATWSQITLSKDVDYSIGVTPSAYMYWNDTTDDFVFAYITTQRSFLFKLGGTEYGELDNSGNLGIQKDVQFFNRSTTYPLSYLIGYQKPVLVYNDSTSIFVEQNTTTANRTLIVFPAGPIACTEDLTSTHKFRMLRIDAAANGYESGDTGAADSGLRSGLTLTENTWYFVYAVVVQYGDDAATDNYILVVDDTKPAPSNWGTLNTRYGSGMWVYLGLFRYGYGLTSGDSIVPFINDKSGWHMFTGRGATDDFFGIKIAEGTITSTTYATIETLTPGDSGDAAPSTCSHMRLAWKPIASGENMQGAMIISDGSDNVLWDLPSFAPNLELDEAHGFSVVVPNVSSLKLKGKTG